jgi:hypothetical protein
MSEVPTVIVTLGALLFITAIFGGGITMKEVTIPAISRRLRIILFPLSIILMAFGIWIAFENPFQSLKDTAAEQAVGTDPTKPVPTVILANPPAAASSPSLTLVSVDDFEAFDTGLFEISRDENGTTASCTIDRRIKHGGESSWWLHWEVVPDGHGICIRSFIAQGNLADWSRGRGISFWYTAEKAGQTVVYWIHIGDPGTGYGVFFDTSEESTAGWVNAEFRWEDLSLLPWEENPKDPFDPSRVNSYGFTLLGGTETAKLDIRIDDVALVSG